MMTSRITFPLVDSITVMIEVNESVILFVEYLVKLEN